MAYSPLCRFAPWLVRALACSPPGWFAHAPWSIRPLACSPPYVVSLRYDDRNSMPIVQGAWANQPVGEQARRRTSQGANRLGGETAKGRKSQIPFEATVIIPLCFRCFVFCFFLSFYDYVAFFYPTLLLLLCLGCSDAVRQCLHV